MTVKELIDELKMFPPDMKVFFSYQSGDHWHTVVAEEAVNLDEETLKYSEYHRKYKIDEDAEEETGSDEVLDAVVLS